MQWRISMFFLVLLLFPSFVIAREPIEIGLATLTVKGTLPEQQLIQDFNENLGQAPSTFNFFLGFNGDKGELPNFPLKQAKKVLANYPGCSQGIIPMVTWEPWGDEQDKNGEWKSPLSEILNGNLDEYIKQFARDMKTYGKPIRLRFGHEMIQNDVSTPIDVSTWGWYPWQDYPKDYVKAYRRVWKIFRRQKANNVSFVWAPNFHMFDVDVIKKYYPGKKYVDWIGIDAYNWQAQTMDEMIQGLYMTVVDHPSIFGKKPIMLSEWGMSESLTDKQTKAEWLADAFDKMIHDYPRIRSFYWFHIDKEHNWRLDETPEAWDVFVQAMQDPVFVGCGS